MGGMINYIVYTNVFIRLKVLYLHTYVKEYDNKFAAFVSVIIICT